MAHALIFDTLRYANKLKAAGVPEKQAEAQAETLAEVVDETLATKQDIKSIDLKIECVQAELKRDIKELELRIVNKLASIIVGCFGVLGVIIVIFQK